ncbi:hypothetical protein COP2_043535 [Malus domestica]
MSKSQGFSWSRLIVKQGIKKPSKAPLPLSQKISTRPHFPATPQPPKWLFSSKIPYSTVSSRAAQDLLAEVERKAERTRAEEEGGPGHQRH